MAKDIMNIEKSFQNMKRQMNRMMNNFFNDSFDIDTHFLNTNDNKLITNNSFKTPASDLYENDNEVIAKIEIPGVNKEDIKLNVENDKLYLKVDNTQSKEDKDEKKGYHRIERSYTGYMRHFDLPSLVDKDNVKAKYKEGILEVKMPKKKLENKEDVKYIDIE